MRELAETGLESSEERIANGLNVEDQPARALSAAYAKEKARRGKQTIRDLNLTGALIGSMAVTDVTPGSAAIDFASDEQERVAYINEAIEPMIGLSPGDVKTVNEKAEKQFAENVRNLFL